MNACRICREPLPAPAYETPAPAITSIMTFLDVPTRVFVCEACGHAQCDDIPEIQTFYDKVYRISLAGDDCDQIFAVEPDGTVVYRTDHQAALALRLLELPQGAHVLDYGAAKADTLRKMHAARPDILPHVFDVSRDYVAAWQGWVPADAQATYDVPSSWTGRFEAVMSHFVIEHVPDPVAYVRAIADLLAPDGVVLLSMPDASANPGDIVVADHLSHFSEASLRRALAEAGLTPTTIDASSFPGAFFVVAERGASVHNAAPAANAAGRAHELCAFWSTASAHLDAEAQRFSGCKAAIYGAGFYGSWIYSRVRDTVDLAAILDRNPHLQGSAQFGVPVLPPEQIPDDIDVLFVGLNPLKAREAIAAQPWLQRPGLAHVWI